MFKQSQIKRRALLIGAATMFTTVAVGQILPQPALAQNVTLNGAGATFPAPLYTRWFSDYRKVKPSVTVNYQAIGSGAGVNQFVQGTVDFGSGDCGSLSPSYITADNKVLPKS